MLIEKLRINLDFGKFVQIDKQKEKEIVKYMISKKEFEDYKPYDWSDYNFWIPNGEGKDVVSQFFALGNAINFRYWEMKNGKFVYCESKKDGIEARGAKYMWRCIKIAYESGNFDIFNTKKLANMKINQFKDIFRADSGNIPIPHLKDRVENWNDFGWKLYEYWGSEFYNLIKEAGKSLHQFIQLSRQFRAFEDPLCKMIMVNAILHQGRKITNFKENVFPGIDYHLVKENLRIGILRPNKTITKKLKNEKYLLKTEMREIRNACLKIFLYLMKETGINGDVLDNMWWSNGKKCSKDNPRCNECVFSPVCEKNLFYKIPLEKTRYY